VVSLSQGRTAAAQCGLFTHKSVPVIFEPPCTVVRTFFMECVSKQIPFVILHTLLCRYVDWLPVLNCEFITYPIITIYLHTIQTGKMYENQR